MTSVNQKIEVFLSYSHQDEELRNELIKHLKLLQRQGIIYTWCDRDINAGTDWAEAIDTHLNSAQIILLLISPDFMASDYCFDLEMRRAMERHETGDAIVIPIILRPVDWTSTMFSKLQGFPKNAKPITTWSNRDEAFLDIAQGLRRTVDKIKMSNSARNSKPIDKLDIIKNKLPEHERRDIDFPKTRIINDHITAQVNARFVLSAQLTADNRAEYEDKKFEIEAIVEYLRELTGDDSIKLIFHQRGSIKIFLEGSPEGLLKLRELFKSGVLTNIMGIPVEDFTLLSKKDLPKLADSLTTTAVRLPVLMPLDNHLKRRYSELQQEYNHLSEEIEYLRNLKSLSNLQPREEFRLDQQIQDAEKKRESINQDLAELDKTYHSEQLYRMLLKLGYEQQVQLFIRLIQAQSVAAFVIHGSVKYGQRWLLNRLVEQYVPQNINSKKIRIELSRTVRRTDIDTLWRELGNKVLVRRSSTYSQQEIVEGVYRLWQTQNLLLVFHDIHWIPQDYLEQLITEFWQPLAQRARQDGLQKSKYKLLCFLIDYEGSVGSLKYLFIDQVNNQVEVPVRSPDISKFTAENVTNWMLHEFNELPYELTHNIDDTVNAILSESDDGIPEYVLQGIFERCGYNYFDEVERLWKL